jgi:hypothetical protein
MFDLPAIPTLRTLATIVAEGGSLADRWMSLLLMVTMVTTAVAALPCIVVVAYLVKSMIGIDLMEGPSILHPLFFD